MADDLKKARGILFGQLSLQAGVGKTSPGVVHSGVGRSPQQHHPPEEFIDNFAADPATAAQFELGRRAIGGRHCKAAVAPADLRHALDKLRSSYHPPDSPPEQNALKGLSNRFRR